MKEANEIPQEIRNGLLSLAFISLGCAVLHAIYPESVDDKTAMFLGIATVALVLPYVSKFKLGNVVEFEREVNQLKEDVKSVGAAVGGLEKDLGPGSKTASASFAIKQAGVAFARATDHPIVPNDPNKHQFGGSSEANGRKLSATITPDAGEKSSRCRVNIKIVSTDPSQPLSGKVQLHLHPSFACKSSYEIDVKGGIAESSIISYGSFTIGAEADGGKTRLELDLTDVEGGTRRFYES